MKKIKVNLNDRSYTITIGSGAIKKLPEVISNIGEKVNSSSSKKYAVDIPSGLDATTGASSKNSLKADKTITFGLAKQGFYTENGPNLCGEILVEEIGFPEDLLK